MDIFKKMGVTVGMPSLIQEETQKSLNEHEKMEGQAVRKGYGSNPRDILESQLQKGGVSVPGASEVKGMHGEEFHTDNDKEVEKESTETKEVTELDGPVKKSMSESDLIMKALSDLQAEPMKKKSIAKKGDLKIEVSHDDEVEVEKANKLFPVKPSLKVPAQPKDEEQKKEEREAAMEKSKSPIKGISKKEIEKIAGLHENSPEVAEQGRGGQPIVKKKSFIKSQGPGGVYFDFGGLTGNPLADNATALLNQTVDPIQAQIVASQRKDIDKAMMSYIEKGEARYMAEQGQGEQDLNGTAQLSKPMDVQVKESFEKGEFGGNNTPAPVTKHSSTEMTLPNGEVIKGMSETDAAVIEMMKGMVNTESSEGVVMEAGPQKVTIDI